MGSQESATSVSELLARVTRQLAGPLVCTQGETSSTVPESATESVLVATAARYCPPAGNFAVTPPTGFDFHAGALFEAIVESAFIVANSDGHFDDVERKTFAKVVLEASDRRISERQIEAIVMDLETQLEEDGLERRMTYLARTIKRPSDRREVLLIATLLAEVSGGVSSCERQVLETLATVFELASGSVDEALAQVRESLLV